MEFVRDVVSCFLGTYAQIPEIVRCDATDMAKLMDVIRPLRPGKFSSKLENQNRSFTSLSSLVLVFIVRILAKHNSPLLLGRCILCFITFIRLHVTRIIAYVTFSIEIYVFLFNICMLHRETRSSCRPNVTSFDRAVFLSFLLPLSCTLTYSSSAYTCHLIFRRSGQITILSCVPEAPRETPSFLRTRGALS